ncbi:MAG: CPBP family intramembrane glutamic endopeptidase [Hyphomicrobiaceae bacterium]
MSVASGIGNGTGRVAALSAAGTHIRPETVMAPGIGRRIRLIVEIGVLYLAVPLLLKLIVFGLHAPLFVVLPPVLLALLAFLLWDRTFRVVAEFGKGFRFVELLSILALFLVVGGIILFVVARILPDDLFSMPLERPRIWKRVMLFYPLLSVLPQELIYRSFFFHRYGPLFGRRRWLAILVNGALFGFGHVIFASYLAMVLTMLLGLVLAWRYERTRSLWAVWLEHSLYGCLIFTVGIGFIFFTGVASVG